MSYYLFLDDYRDPTCVTWVRLPARDRQDWVIVRNYKEFVAEIEEQGIPKFVAFDHDLAEEHYSADWLGHPNVKEMTGYDCAKWLVNHCEKSQIKFPDYEVHSMNPVGRANIRGYIENAKRILKI